MRIIPRILISALVIALALGSCKKSYMPQAISSANNYLVVEGFINLTDSTIITLSRTVNLTSATTRSPELGAMVAVENSKGNTYPLIEKGNGVYAAASLNLSSADMYRLRITTTGHTTYISDLVSAKVTPPIDTLITRILGDGVHFSISTHDAANNTRYYKWDVTETWEFNSFWRSEYYYDGSKFVFRTSQIQHCWGNYNYAGALLTSTVQQSQDVILDRPLDFISLESEKLHVRFSLLVKQYGLTKEAYNYWTKLKSNTEDIGSVFDAQPSSLTGNVHNNNNAAEPVIGFISAGTISRTRIFIGDADLPGAYRAAYQLATPYTLLSCPIKVVQPQDYNTVFDPRNPYFIPVEPAEGALPLCVDCTLRGNTTRPAFWK